MPRKIKNKPDRSAFSVKPKLTLKQRIFRRTFRAFPSAMNGFFIFMILAILAAMGSIGWQAFAQSGGGVSSPSPNHTVEYQYDDHGMLVGRFIKDGAGTVIEDRRFLVDYHNATGYPQFAAVKDGKTGRILRQNAWGPDGLLSQTEWISGNEYVARYPMCDAQGTVHAVRHEYHGGPKNGTTEVTRHDYSAFGIPLNAPPAINYAFQGQWRDPDTGKQFHRARWYDPKAGRWLSPDPSFDFPDNFGNAYAFVGNDPVNNTDPFGEFSIAEIQSTQIVQATLAAMNTVDVVNALRLAGTVATGGSVSAFEAAFALIDLISPFSTGLSKISRPFVKHRNLPAADVKILNKAFAQASHMKIGDQGESVLFVLGKQRGFNRYPGFSPRHRGYDNVFTSGKKSSLENRRRGLMRLPRDRTR